MDETKAMKALFPWLGSNRGDYRLFLVSGEGIFHDDGFEETSGYILYRDGHVTRFWLGWDEVAGGPIFRGWDVPYESRWEMVREYRNAREALGLVETPRMRDE